MTKSQTTALLPILDLSARIAEDKGGELQVGCQPGLYTQTCLKK